MTDQQTEPLERESRCTPADKHAHIDITAARTTLTPALLELIAPLLECEVHSFKPGGRRGYERTTEINRFYEVCTDGRMQIPEGIVPAAVDRLERAGYQVNVEDRRQFGPRFDLHPKLMQQVNPHDKGFLELVAQHPRGLIKVCNDADMAWRVALICRLHPSARTLIAVARRAELDFLYRRLVGPLGGQIETREDWAFKRHGNRLLCTYRIFDLCPPDEWDIIILPKAVEALAPSHQHNLARLSQRKIYGFLDDAELSVREQLTLLCACGPEIGTVDHTDEIANKVRVLWCRHTSKQHGLQAKTPVGLKRERLWQNSERNAFIAEVASAMVENNQARLSDLGICVSDAYLQSLPSAIRGVAILVEVPEHGRELLRRLPGWRLLEQKEPIERVGWRGHHKTIMTTLRFKRLTNLGASIIIRADGTPWPLCAEVFPPALPDGGEVLLVDFEDAGDDVGREACRSRARSYRQLGWQMMG